MRRSIIVAATVLALMGCTPTEPPCPAPTEPAVHTDHQFTDAEFPGIGDYAEIHWQARVLGNPCSRAPGPTDFAYQALIRLQPTDARTLSASYTWQPSGPPEVSTGLAPFRPAAAQWRSSSEYVERKLPGYGGSVYLDEADALLFLAVSTR